MNIFKKNRLSIKSPLKKLFASIDRGDVSKILALIVWDNSLLSQTNEKGLTPLMDATIGKKYDVMHLLLLHGANMSQTDEDGWTAKSWAVFIQDKEALKILSRVSVLSNTDDVSGVVFGLTAWG
jgi:ankyrin repeat protein